MWLAQINIFFFFNSLFSCTSQQHGLYILSVGRMTEYWGGSVPTLFKVTVPLLLGETKENQPL